MHGLLLLIAQPRVGLRPGRIEPRQHKRRPRPYPLMTKPRKEEREQVRLNRDPAGKWRRVRRVSSLRDELEQLTLCCLAVEGQHALTASLVCHLGNQQVGQIRAIGRSPGQHVLQY
jgi:hypothetical protein